MDIPERNQLNIEDPDSIFLFGNDIQTRINGFTKTISEIILYGQNQTDYILMDMKHEMDTFENALRKSNGWWNSFIIGATNIQSNYSRVLSNINKLELALKLQEAKLLKDIKVFKSILPLMEAAEIDMNTLIQYGQQELAKNTNQSSDIEKKMWFDRLEKRLNDLEVSHTILLQTYKQIEMLMTNDTYLVDKILATLGTTIPIWRTQVALFLGLETMSEQTILQNKIESITEKQVKENGAILKRNIQRAKKKKNIDVERIKKLNESFIKEMDHLEDTENKNNQIIENTKQIVLKI